MKILFADSFPAEYLDVLRSAGHDCHIDPQISADSLPQVIGDAEVLVVRSTRVTEQTIAASTLKLIVRAGAGTNTIDKAAARARDIPVCNVPGKNALAVAELAFGLLLCIDRRIPDAIVDLRAKQWDKKRYSQARGIHGRKIGVVGLGSIGLALAVRAAAFGMQVHVIASATRSPQTVAQLKAMQAVEMSDLGALAAECDVISFHLPANADTQGIINRDLLSKMQPDTIIINTARGELIDEQALIDAMDTRGIRAGLDVFQNEPTSGRDQFTSALAQHPNVYGTHHIGASTAQAQDAVAKECVNIIQAFLEGTTLHCVN